MGAPDTSGGRGRRKLWLRVALSVGVISVVGAAASVVVAGSRLTSPAQHSVGEPPADLPIEPVQLTRADGTFVRGWAVPEGYPRGRILLLHGSRADRREMLERARFLNMAGYATLMIDLRAHGQTDGDQITFGYREAEDVRLALQHMREQLPHTKIGLIGVSLGGAAALLGPSPAKVDAMVLESVYSNLEQALDNRLRLRLGPIGSWVTPLLAWQVEPRLGVQLGQLSPETAIRSVTNPVLIMSGARDQRTTLLDTQALYAAAPEPKQLWVVPDAIHQDLHHFARAEYERRVLTFFARHLAGPVIR